DTTLLGLYFQQPARAFSFVRDCLKPRHARGLLFASRVNRFFEPEIDHYVMAITAAEAIVRHSTPHQTAHVAAEHLRERWRSSMRGQIINEYRTLNSEDQKEIRRWLWANTVVGA